MTAKYEKQILKLATDRGWQTVRRGGHNQIIIEYPKTGARMYLWSTPKTRPSPAQLMAKMVGLERSTRTKDQNDLLEWICDRYGIPADGSKIVEEPLTIIVNEFLGREPKDKREGDRYKNAIAHSPRVWLTSIAERGANSHTPRLFLGRDAVLSPEQLEMVRSWPQVNKVFDDLPGPQERLNQMTAFAESRGFFRTNNRNLGLPGKEGRWSIRAAYELAEKMPEITDQQVPVTAPEPVVAPTPADRQPPADGIVVVDGEPPVHTEKWLEENQKAAATVGLPVELVAMLREALKIDNGNVISGMDMVRDALGSAIDAATVMVKSLEDLDAAIELIKVEA